MRPLKCWLEGEVSTQPIGTRLPGPRIWLTRNIVRDVEPSIPDKRPVAATAAGPRCCRFPSDPTKGSLVPQLEEDLVQDAQIVSVSHQIAISVEEPIQTRVCFI